MGYSELPCQLCGVSFCLGRVRSAEEPQAAAWRPQGWPGGDTFVEEDVYSSQDDCGPETGCCLALRKSRNKRWERYSALKSGQEANDEEWYPDYDEATDSTYEYESDEDDEPLEYDSDGSDSERGDPEHFYQENDERVLERVLPIELRQGENQRDIFMPIKASTAQDKKNDDKPNEHVAGPGCQHTRGYKAYNISFEEMERCTTVQSLVLKGSYWTQERDDEDFEIYSNYFLSGLAPQMPSTDERNPEVIIPRHQVDELNVNHYAFGPAGTVMPFHPTCFEIFKRLSKLHFGQIDVNGLMNWRNIFFQPPGWGRFPRDPAVRRGLDQEWIHNEGDEFLAANPVFVPGLEPILRSAIQVQLSFSPQGGAFVVPQLALDASSSVPSLDPFLKLPREITDNIVELLGSQDIANLRLSSRVFRQLRISLWYNLLRKEMPWLWEVWSDEKPSYWASVSITDIIAEKYVRPKFEAELQGYRSIIKADMPEIFDDWCAAEPTFDDWAVTSKDVYTEWMPLKLPRSQTNWYQLYCDIAVNWKDLKGLHNRLRIWKDIEEIISRIKQFRAEGKII